MKRIATVLALVALGACQKAEQKPAQTAADTSHMMMSDTSHMMADTSMKMAPAPAPAPAPKPAAKTPAKKKRP